MGLDRCERTAALAGAAHRAARHDCRQARRGVQEAAIVAADDAAADGGAGAIEERDAVEPEALSQLSGWNEGVCLRCAARGDGVVGLVPLRV